MSNVIGTITPPSFLHISQLFLDAALRRLVIGRILVIALCLSGSASFLYVYHLHPWVVFYSDILAFVTLALGGLWCAIQGGRFDWRLSSTFFVLLAMAVIPIVQYFMGVIVFYGDALVASFFLLAAAIAYSLGFSLADQPREAVIKWLAWFFFIVGLISALTGFIQWFGLEASYHPYIYFSGSAGSRVSGGLNQANNYATLLVLGMFSVFYLHYKRHLSGITVVVCLTIIVMACAMAQSKTSWISVAFVCVCGIFFQKKYSLCIKSRWMVYLILGFVFCVVSIPWLASYIFGGSVSIADRVTGDSPRLAMWTGLFVAVIENPLWGYGWQQVSNAQLAFGALLGPVEYTHHSHNLLLDLVLWNGCLMGGGIAVFFGYKLFRTLFECKTEESWFLLAIISPILIHSMLEYPLDYAYFLLPFALVLGLSSQKIDGARLGGVLRRGVPKHILVLICFSLGVILWQAVHEYKQHEAKRARDSAAAKGGDVSHILLSAPRFEMFSQLSGMADFAKAPVKTNLTDGELDNIRKVVYRFTRVEILFKYALILAVNGREREAALTFEKLKNMYGEISLVEACGFLGAFESKYPQLADVQFGCP